MDRGKVIDRLQKVSRYFKSMLKVGYDGDSDIYKEHSESVKMAIELLKEHEAVEPKYKERMGGFVAGLCPTCGTALNNVLNVKACGKCGQAVKWDD